MNTAIIDCIHTGRDCNHVTCARVTAWDRAEYWLADAESCTGLADYIVAALNYNAWLADVGQ